MIGTLTAPAARPAVANALPAGWAAVLALAMGMAGTGCSPADGASSAPPPAPQRVIGRLAFAGAVGHGAGSAGGRGGQIIAVTTLNDSGAGSLRACIDATGPRTCIFRVSGLIRFTRQPPVIRNPFITIAGQTAPGAGVTIAHGGGATGRTPIVVKNTHDVVIRFIRVRNDRIGGNRGSEDSFTIENSENVVLDHVSASWARDELVNGYGDNDRITVSNSLFAEGVPPHDKCALLASDPKGAQRFSFIGNVCANNGDRNPEINFPPGSCVEVVNNVLYNGQSAFAEIWEKFGGTPVALIGNSFIAGPDTARRATGIMYNRLGSTGQAQIYLWDNKFQGNFTQISPEISAAAKPSPRCPGTVAALPAAAAYANALAGAGAFPRDSLDARIIDGVRNRTGRLIEAPGTIPAIALSRPYPDADRDGMDDRWEARNGADPHRFDPWADANRDGVANMDAFLAGRARAVMGSAV